MDNEKPISGFLDQYIKEEFQCQSSDINEVEGNNEVYTSNPSVWDIKMERKIDNLLDHEKEMKQLENKANDYNNDIYKNIKCDTTEEDMKILVDNETMAVKNLYGCGVSISSTDRPELSAPTAAQRFTCEKCNKSLAFKNDLRRHLIRVHDNVRNFRCHLCQKPFKARSYLNEHMHRHENPVKFMCELCSKIYMWKRNLQKHLLAHARNIGKYIPGEENQCQKLEVHTDSFYCQICKKTYVSLTKLKRHMLLHKNVDKFRCDDCRKGFSRMCSLKRHQETVHSNIRNFMCDFCGKSFTHIWRLKEHKEYHIQVKKSKCEICHNCFIDIEKHKLVHLKNLTHLKKFKTKRKVHAGAQCFSCENCHKSFTSKGVLRIHLQRVHDNMRNFKCDLCQKSFKSSWYLNEHKNKHDNIKFMCELCCKSFSWKNRLKKHLLSHAAKIEEYISAKPEQSQQLATEQWIAPTGHGKSIILEDNIESQETTCATGSLPFAEVFVKEEQLELSYSNSILEENILTDKNIHKNSREIKHSISKGSEILNMFSVNKASNADSCQDLIGKHHNSNQRSSGDTYFSSNELQGTSQEGKWITPIDYGNSVILEGHTEREKKTYTTEATPFLQVYVKGEQSELNYSNVAQEENILMKDTNIHRNSSKIKHGLSDGSAAANVFLVNKASNTNSNQDLICKYENISHR